MPIISVLRRLGLGVQGPSRLDGKTSLSKKKKFLSVFNHTTSMTVKSRNS
jgi:hypothetical protein